jgi:hypothetical protein
MISLHATVSRLAKTGSSILAVVTLLFLLPVLLLVLLVLMFSKPDNPEVGASHVD